MKSWRHKQLQPCIWLRVATIKQPKVELLVMRVLRSPYCLWCIWLPNSRCPALTTLYLLVLHSLREWITCRAIPPNPEVVVTSMHLFSSGLTGLILPLRSNMANILDVAAPEGLAMRKPPMPLPA